MEIRDKKDGVRIQIRPLHGGPSRSITLYEEDVNTVYNRIWFLYKNLESSDGSVRMIHYG